METMARIAPIRNLELAPRISCDHEGYEIEVVSAIDRHSIGYIHRDDTDDAFRITILAHDPEVSHGVPLTFPNKEAALEYGRGFLAGRDAKLYRRFSK